MLTSRGQRRGRSRRTGWQAAAARSAAHHRLPLSKGPQAGPGFPALCSWECGQEICFSQQNISQRDGWKPKNLWGKPHMLSWHKKTHLFQGRGHLINPDPKMWTTWSSATRSGRAAWGRNKPFHFRPLRCGSHQPILTDAEIKRDRCRDDRMRKAKGGEQKRQRRNQRFQSWWLCNDASH